MLAAVATYNVVRIFPFPREIRFLEILILIFLYLKLSVRIGSIEINRVNQFFVFFSILAVSSIFLTGSISLERLQEVYIRVVPFIFFIVAAQIGVSEEYLKKGAKFFAIVLIANILVAVFYQLPFYGYHEDNINGFYEDAHMFGNFLALFSVVLFYDYLANHRNINLFISFSLLIFSIYPLNGKVIVLNVIAICMLYINHVLTKWKIVNKILLSFTVVLVISFSYIQVNNYLLYKSGLRIDETIDYGVNNLGPFVAWPIAWNATTSSFQSTLIGLGVGEYGWILASREVMDGKGSLYAQMFELEFSFNNRFNSGFLFRTNTWTSLLAEFGLLGFISFIAALAFIVKVVIKAKARSRFERNMKVTFYTLLVIIVFQGLFTPFSNWSESILTFPMMFIAAHFVRDSSYPKP